MHLHYFSCHYLFCFYCPTLYTYPMLTTHKYDGETWVDIDSGTPEEIRGVIDTYKIHPLLARELSVSTRKARVEFHGDFIYCILHFPAFKHSHEKQINQEVDFIIGRNLLVTGRYDTIDAMHKFAKFLDVKEVLDKGAKGASGDTYANTYAPSNLGAQRHTNVADHFIFIG